MSLKGAVCKSCNNTWMSVVENRVKEFLGPMIVRHEKTNLSLEQQQLLATWAVKTAYLVELAFHLKYPRRRPILGYFPTQQEFSRSVSYVCIDCVALLGPSGHFRHRAQYPSWAATSPNSAVMVAETTLDIPARSIVAPNLPSGGS